MAPQKHKCLLCGFEYTTEMELRRHIAYSIQHDRRWWEARNPTLRGDNYDAYIQSKLIAHTYICIASALTRQGRAARTYIVCW